MTREVHPPRGRYNGRHRVFSTVKRQWDILCRSRPGPMRRCYVELADRPYPAAPTRRHHGMKGRLKDFWEYEVGGAERVRYKRGEDGDPVVSYAGSAPPDTH